MTTKKIKTEEGVIKFYHQAKPNLMRLNQQLGIIIYFAS